MTEFGFGHATDVGRVRSDNQDRYFGDGTVFAVADGMGGHSGGEVASGLVVDSLVNRERIADLADLVNLVHHVNDRIVETARDDPTLHGMGTTISVLAALDLTDGEGRLGIANVGDSRIYRLIGTELEQITEDHSLVEALVRDGRLTPEEASRHPQRNILTRALGIDEKVLVDAWELRAVTGDRYVVCSDGLFNELTAAEMSEVVASTDDPQAAADVLVARACDVGGRDNVTAVVVHVTDADDAGDDDQRVLSIRRAVPEAGTLPPSAPRDEADGSPHGDDDEAGDGDPSPSAPVGAERGRVRGRITWRVGALVVAVVVIVVLAITAVAAWARSSYYVGVQGPDVVIFQGRPGGVLWFDPTVEEPVNLGVVELDDADLDALRAGVEFGDIGEARDYGRRLALRVRSGN